MDDIDVESKVSGVSSLMQDQNNLQSLTEVSYLFVIHRTTMHGFLYSFCDGMLAI